MNAKKNDPDLITVGAVAKSFGVSDNAIRRMEAAGLLKPALVKESGYRYYGRDNISRIKTILSLRELGLVYEDMREYFKNPGDFKPIYDKLFEKKLALDALLDHSRHFIRPVDPGEFFLVPHQEICFYAKTYKLSRLNDFNAIDEFSLETLTSAVKGKYPVDNMRPITILSTCLDYRQFDVYAPQELTFCVPLREKVDSPDTYVMPSRTVLSFAWYYGLDLSLTFDNIIRFMDDKKLRQCDVIGATFEVGKYLDRSIDDNKYLFHFMLPCEEI